MFATPHRARANFSPSAGVTTICICGDGIRASYSRITVGGQTELQVDDDNGMRLFPAGSCKMAGRAKKMRLVQKRLLPFPKEWRPS